MEKIFYIDRKTHAEQEEPVYCARSLHFLYASSIGKCLEWILSHSVVFSSCIGWWHKTSWSCKKIRPFVQTYGLRTEEFTKALHEYTSFNDFFIRTLKQEARPIVAKEGVCITPADGAYFVFPCIDEHRPFFIKGRRFCLEQFLNCSKLAEAYVGGSMVIARLAPFDYHRFHFPFACTPSSSRRINGYLHSVHPLALRRNCKIFYENKREYCVLRSEYFGEVLFIEVGALGVGAIVQTYVPEKRYLQGDEKGFFEFGGSTIVMLFKANTIVFDEDLVEASSKGLEMRCFMGQTLGKVFVE